jgi:DNA-binding NtrC family response regulator
MSRTLPALIVSGTSQRRDSLAQAVSQSELRPVCCQTFAAAKALMTRQQFAVIVCEDLLPDGNFRAMVGEGTRRRGRQPVMVISSRDDWESCLLVMGAGAFDCFSSSSATREVERILPAALQDYRHSAETMAQPEAREIGGAGQVSKKDSSSYN